MNKAEILQAISRIAVENGGKAPGSQAFERQTGIRKSDWYPQLWLRWGDAVTEAGCAANEFQTAMPNDLLIQKYMALAKELKHLPVEGELRRQATLDKTFPSHSTFGRFGGKHKLLEAVLHYCRQHSGNEDIIALCENRKVNSSQATDLRPSTTQLATGFVYLMKSGRHYKIGHTNSVGSRERQLAIKIPIPPTTIHRIETDDPVGVEAYWHRRFDDKRGEGEWFDLRQDDIKAFKRWKRIV